MLVCYIMHSVHRSEKEKCVGIRHSICCLSLQELKNTLTLLGMSFWLYFRTTYIKVCVYFAFVSGASTVRCS